MDALNENVNYNFKSSTKFNYMLESSDKMFHKDTYVTFIIM